MLTYTPRSGVLRVPQSPDVVPALSCPQVYIILIVTAMTTIATLYIVITMRCAIFFEIVMIRTIFIMMILSVFPEFGTPKIYTTTGLGPRQNKKMAGKYYFLV